jgi:hypothetical protein
MNVMYCTRSDLVFIKADIGSYDRKAVIQNWITDSGIVRKSANIGQGISVLYRDSLELGSAESSSGAVSDDGEWYYDENADVLWLASTQNPATNHVVEMGIDIKTLQEDAIQRASDFIRAYVNKPIMPRKGTSQADASGGDYEEIINRSCAILSSSYLIRATNPESANELEKQVIDTETGMGYLDRIKRGEIKLWNEATERMGDGVVSVISQDSTSTGTIVDTRGEATISYDNIKVTCSTGGTFTMGTASPVKMDSYISDSTGLQTTKYANAEIVDGSYLNIGRGISVRFSPGIFVAGDTWSIEVNGDFVESGQIKNAQAYRG